MQRTSKAFHLKDSEIVQAAMVYDTKVSAAEQKVERFICLSQWASIPTLKDERGDTTRECGLRGCYW